MIELDALDDDMATLCLASDINSGLVPPGARRGLLASEIQAKVNFLAIEQDSQTDTDHITEELIAARLVMRHLLADDLRSRATTVERISRLQELSIVGLGSVSGIPQLVTESAGQLRKLIGEAAQHAATRMAKEASAQGVSIPADLSLDAASGAVLDQQANRLAMVPQADALRALVEGIAPLPSTISPDEVLTTVDSIAADLSENPLSRVARQAVSSATGIGRMSIAESSGHPVEIFASELLDRATCSPCVHVDGRRYLTFEALRRDYPSGLYIHCLGGLQCRGTPVVVYRQVLA
jgi:hypothetical protein